MINQNQSARDELSDICVAKSLRMFEITQKHLPAEAYEEFSSLYGALISFSEDLVTKSDDELERLRYMERHIHPICPRMESIEPGHDWLEPSPPIVLDKLCDRRDCSDKEGCWAVTQLTEPRTEVLGVLKIRRVS